MSSVVEWISNLHYDTCFSHIAFCKVKVSRGVAVSEDSLVDSQMTSDPLSETWKEFH